MVTGDHPDVAESVGGALGVDRILSERAPDEKVEAVEIERGEGGVIIMVGDGLNDAPALAAADVGVAMGARGATASSEAADVVLVVDRLDRLADAITIAKRSRRIAVQSVVMGMGLAFGFMFFGAFGIIGPIGGAIVQEFIDVASILNALRALGGGRGAAKPHPATDVAERFRAEHLEFRPELQRIRSVADRLGTMSLEETRAELEAVRWFIVERLPQHEEEEESAVYPIVAELMGGEDPMASMARAHIEIDHLARVYRSLLDELPPDGPDPEDIMDLRRVLYGLHAILRLHFAQEEEAYAWLVVRRGAGRGPVATGSVAAGSVRRSSVRSACRPADPTGTRGTTLRLPRAPRPTRARRAARRSAPRARGPRRPRSIGPARSPGGRARRSRPGPRAGRPARRPRRPRPPRRRGARPAPRSARHRACASRCSSAGCRRCARPSRDRRGS